MGCSSRGLWTPCVLVIGFVVSSLASEASTSEQECSQDAECGSDRSLLLQYGVLVDPMVVDDAYPNAEMVVKKEDLGTDWSRSSQSWHPVTSEVKDLMKAAKMKTNSHGDFAVFMSSFVLDIILCLMCVAFFCIVHRWYPLVYMDNVLKGFAPEFPKTCLGWVGAAWNLSSEDIERVAGLDAAMFMDFVHLSLRLLMQLAVPMVLILCPLHLFAGGHRAVHDQLSQLGMANVVEGEGARWIYWVHAVFVWYVVVMAQRAIFQAQESFGTVDLTFKAGQHLCSPNQTQPSGQECLAWIDEKGTVIDVPADSEAERAGVKPGWTVLKIDGQAFTKTSGRSCPPGKLDFTITFQYEVGFLKKRHDWLCRMARPRSTTVLVEGIPPDCCNNDALKEEFCRLFPGDQVDTAYVVRNTSKLVSLVNAYNSADLSVDKAKYEWTQQGGREDQRPQCRDWAFGKLVDEIDFYTEQRNKLGAQVELERKFLADPDNSEEVYANTGFVTFKTERSAAIALCLKVRHDESFFMMSTPPDPVDVTYSDLYANQGFLTFKAIVGYTCMIAVFFGFTPIILAISSIINLDALRKTIPLVDQFVHAVPMSERLLEGVLASAALTLFMSFLPTIFMVIFDSCYQLKAGRWAQHRLQIWYFWFMVIFVLLITAVGGSLWDTILALINHPTLICDLLANRLPTTTHFYLNFMLMQWVVHAMNLTRYVNLAKFKALRILCEEQQAKDLSEPEDQDYYGMGARSARFTLNLVIALVYCSLSPLILLVTAVNFLICKVIYGYLLVFAESRKPDLGGHFWVTQLVHVQYGLLLYVVLMLGVLAHRAATIGPAVVVAPCLLYWIRSNSRFHSELQWETMPFEEYADKGRATVKMATMKSISADSSKSESPSRFSYEQPELTEPVVTTL